VASDSVSGVQRAQDEETGEDPLLEAFTALRKKIFFWHGE
jgi:hypothetical protein